MKTKKTILLILVILLLGATFFFVPFIKVKSSVSLLIEVKTIEKIPIPNAVVTVRTYYMLDDVENKVKLNEKGIARVRPSMYVNVLQLIFAFGFSALSPHETFPPEVDSSVANIKAPGYYYDFMNFEDTETKIDEETKLISITMHRITNKRKTPVVDNLQTGSSSK